MTKQWGRLAGQAFEVELKRAATAGGRRIFLIITTVTLVLPRFFCAPKKMTEKFMIGMRLDKMFEDMSATTIGPSPSAAGFNISGKPGNSTPIVAVIYHCRVLRELP